MPIEREKAEGNVAYAIQFFEQQCLDDSDFIEGEFLFEVTRLPRTEAESAQMARRFEEDASRWANYEDDDEDEDGDDDE